jgi:hypothetical protein
MEKIEEVWKECGESPQRFYEVSNLGQVRSITKVNKKESVLKGKITGNGYLRVDIVRKKILIHHLVAYAFLGPRPKGLQIDHIDRNKLNNKADNLRYCTRFENIKNRDDYRDDILEEDQKKRSNIFCKEYHEANKEKISKQRKEYYEANKEKISEKQKEKYKVNKEKISEKNKEKYTCECGIELTKGSKARHEKSQIHKAYLENLNK